MLYKLSSTPTLLCCGADKSRLQYNQFNGELQCLDCGNTYVIADVLKLHNKIEQLRELIWGYDIPSPTVPEYREHHESIQYILKATDEILREIERSAK